MIVRLFGRKGASAPAQVLYALAVARARDPQFYAALGVPDTVDGRFDLVALHVFLLVRRLGKSGEPGSALAQRLFDDMFDDMEINLREMGVGDLGVGKKVKKMAKAFYGRADAYERGLAGDDELLEDALRRNLYGTAQPAPRQVTVLARYVRHEARALEAADSADLLKGTADFGPVPDLGSGSEQA